ncbi:hypothetical protein WMY93_000265 [Mugilogobius chulae]|uniref:SH3 domain-binding protein 5 n=1 Tax=Mugilogobius chulae TaxID=88201 RepID=A0AAW0Q1R1_9GOBI
MEPGDQRESPAGSGESDTGEWREASPVRDPEEGKEGKVTAADASGADSCGETLTGPGGKEEDGGTKQLITGEKVHSPYEEELDPRIQDELEQLNEASAEINKLELQLDDARSNYRKILTESARKLNAQSSQLGACIEKARPYYEARRLAKEAQQETQKAALRFERAVSMHTAAREMVYVAEQGLMADGKNTLDPTWQEMLNHATGKVNEAEEERLRSEPRAHESDQSLSGGRSSSPDPAEFNHILEEHKTTVLQLEETVSKVKTRYSVALRNLEQISEEIHAQRGSRESCPSLRSPPVGAEARETAWTAERAEGPAEELIRYKTVTQDRKRAERERERTETESRERETERAETESREK